jgi:hypothetical protein
MESCPTAANGRTGFSIRQLADFQPVQASAAGRPNLAGPQPKRSRFGNRSAAYFFFVVFFLLVPHGAFLPHPPAIISPPFQLGDILLALVPFHLLAL